MSWKRTLAKISGFLGRRTRDSELNEEVRAHLEMEEQENRAAGMPPDEAHYAALRKFGSVARAEEDSREAWTWSWLETLLQDIRYGARQLRRNPGFTAVAVLTLALGIGANTAIFSYINAFVLKPLPFPNSDRLMIFESHNIKSGWTRESISSTASLLDFEKRQTSFEQIAHWTQWEFNLTGDGPPTLVEGGRVSWNLFEMLGAKPILGRTFTPDEDSAETGQVAILSEGLWQSRYAGNPNIVGQNIVIGGEAYTVVGVLPATFQFPLMGIANLWTPLRLTDAQRADRSGSFFSAFGRLKAAVTEKQAGAECGTIFAGLAKQFPTTNTDLTLLVSSMRWDISRKEGAPELTICLVIVAFILLIACANVANLMLARATNRAREFAMRNALGASKARLVRQLLVESVVLFFLAGVAGLFVGLLGMRWIDSEIPAHIRGFLVNYGRVDLDIATLAFTMGLALLCGFVFGLAPARENSNHDVNSALKEAGNQASGGQRSVRLRRVLVVAEVTLAVLVLISTTLLVKSAVISVRSSPGFKPVNLTVAQLALPKTAYPDEWQWRSFSDEVLARMKALPQVESAGVASWVPFGGFGRAVEIEAVDKPIPQPGERRGGQFVAVSANYFSTLQIGLVKGRLFDSTDSQGGLNVAIINQTMAHDLWPNEDPLGQKVRFGPQPAVGTIVGVVNDVKTFNLRERPHWQMYVPLTQFPSATLSFVVRTIGNPELVAPAMRDAIWAVDRDQPISSAEQLKSLIAIEEAGHSMLAKLLSFFAALAAFLGVVGIYGVISEQVSRRTHEIGIRMALGARRPQVLRMVVCEGLNLALTGIFLGVIFALGTSRLLATDLYGVAPYDPLTFVSVPVAFAARRAGM